MSQDITALQKSDLDRVIAGMRDFGLAPNTIASYVRILKSFLSWCNEEGITQLNIKLYKGEETIKETYSDAELALLLKKPDLRKCSFVEYRCWVICCSIEEHANRWVHPVPQPAYLKIQVVAVRTCF